MTRSYPVMLQRTILFWRPRITTDCVQRIFNYLQQLVCKHGKIK